MQSTCPVCNGKGKIIKNKCHVCGGKKIMDDIETFHITIEKGMPYGEKIVLSNSAGDYIEKSSSDLIFLVKEQKHDFYQRKKNDLHAEVKISLKNALLGFTKNLRTLDNRFIRVSQEGIT